jgi:hypothetical protein
MNHKGIVFAIIIFGIVIVGMFVFAYMKKTEQAIAPTTDTNKETPTPYDSIQYIDGKHFFNGSTHTIVGEILLSTPCDLLNWDPIIMESMPEQVRINFTVINNTEACTQVITPQKFFVEFNASEKATIEAFLNGRSVVLNLIPAAPGETPENYEFSPKG